MQLLLSYTHTHTPSEYIYKSVIHILYLCFNISTMFCFNSQLLWTREQIESVSGAF